jgi:hypothetical protein
MNDYTNCLKYHPQKDMNSDFKTREFASKKYFDNYSKHCFSWKTKPDACKLINRETNLKEMEMNHFKKELEECRNFIMTI